MKNILKNAENAEKLLELTSDTMILLDRNGICVDIAVHNADLWFLKEISYWAGIYSNCYRLLPTGRFTPNSRKYLHTRKFPPGTTN